jgi:hypothetical protein
MVHAWLELQLFIPPTICHETPIVPQCGSHASEWPEAPFWFVCLFQNRSDHTCMIKELRIQESGRDCREVQLIRRRPSSSAREKDIMQISQSHRVSDTQTISSLSSDLEQIWSTSSPGEKNSRTRVVDLLTLPLATPSSKSCLLSACVVHAAYHSMNASAARISLPRRCLLLYQL